ncbi:hypothetical protein [Photobacterium alginatilyticum]|uniref:Uncharacterized protein n=1 Tax=Photobacterium alginatilyticum TaxID=1775171 RepID=A0ABW9YQ87_9GAMM|nr:hypothetical protein [Photobacterium alginatilyticum]NBI56108.1 hypothetical protein [Photobacterium alginatilyticum]
MKHLALDLSNQLGMQANNESTVKHSFAPAQTILKLIELAFLNKQDFANLDLHKALTNGIQGKAMYSRNFKLDDCDSLYNPIDFFEVSTYGALIDTRRKKLLHALIRHGEVLPLNVCSGNTLGFVIQFIQDTLNLKTTNSFSFDYQNLPIRTKSNYGKCVLTEGYYWLFVDLKSLKNVTKADSNYEVIDLLVKLSLTQLRIKAKGSTGSTLETLAFNLVGLNQYPLINGLHNEAGDCTHTIVGISTTFLNALYHTGVEMIYFPYYKEIVERLDNNQFREKANINEELWGIL